MRLFIRDEEAYPVYMIDAEDVASGGVGEDGVEVSDELIQRYLANDLEWTIIQNELSDLHDIQEGQFAKKRKTRRESSDVADSNPHKPRVVYCPPVKRESA